MNENAERELTLRDYARVVARRKWIVIAAVGTTVLAALGMSALQNPIYEASAQMLVVTRSSDTVFGNASGNAGNPERAVATEIKVLESERVADRVRTDLDLAAEPPPVSGRAVGATDVINASVQSGDATTARILADAYVNAYISVKREQSVNALVAAGTELQKKVTELQQKVEAIDQTVLDAPEEQRAQVEADNAGERRILVDQQALFNQKLDELQVDAALTAGSAQVVRQASQPASPIEPTPLRTAAVALIISLFLGLAAAFLLDYLDDSIRTRDDLERVSGGLPVLGIVPIDPPPDNRPISISKPADFAVETYRGLRTSLQFLSLDAEVHILQVTSPLSGDGKTTTAANLAVVLAQAGRRVVLIDADLRKPRLHELFSVDPSQGLTTALLGAPVQPLVQRVFENLDLLPSGPVPPNPSEMLGSRQMRAVLAALAESYEFVIVDSAPVLPVTDSVALSTLVQGVLLVTKAGSTSSKQISDALMLLRRVQAPVLGTVLNKSGKGGHGGYGGYSGYGGYGGYGAAAAMADETSAASVAPV